MLNLDEATKIITENLPGGRISAVVEYKNLFLFQVFHSMPFEEELDPFFSVDRDTGEFDDFSIIVDGNINEVIPLFVQANKLKGVSDGQVPDRPEA